MLTVAGRRLFFRARSGRGDELWSTDGSKTGVVYQDPKFSATPHSLLAVGDVGVRTLGMSPVRTEDLAPPRSRGDTSGVLEVVGQQPTEHERPPELLGIGPPAGGLDEAGELAHGHRCDVDREGVDGDLDGRGPDPRGPDG